jgi:biopolymer transport protein ExbD
VFFQKKMNKSSDGSHEINMTPLIDVSLVLVVMLMLATPLAFESSITVKNSKRSAKVSEQESHRERVEVRVFSEDSVRVNLTIVSRKELMDTLRPLVTSSVDRFVVVRCGDNVSHGTFVDVLDQAKMSGASEIAVVGR